MRSYRARAEKAEKDALFMQRQYNQLQGWLTAESTKAASGGYNIVTEIVLLRKRLMEAEQQLRQRAEAEADVIEDDCYERIPRGALTVKIVEVKELHEDIGNLLSIVKRGMSLCASATNSVARDKFLDGVDGLPWWLRERLASPAPKKQQR